MPRKPRVSHVPPPVTAWDVPALVGATNVPEPVSVIKDPSLAMADAIPPGNTSVPWTLTMSQRPWSAAPKAREPVPMTDNNPIAIAHTHRCVVLILTVLPFADRIGTRLRSVERDT